MAKILKEAVLSVLSETCYENYFEKFIFFDGPCFKQTLSKGLGIGIIAGSIMVKVPQILKIMNARSAAGISFVGVCLELFAITASFAYSFMMGFPFSAWGEGTFLAIQTSIIASLVLFYGGSQSKALTFLTAYVGLVAALISGYTPIGVLWNMQALTVPIVLVAKSIQVATNYKNGSTGQLSAVTSFLLFGGSVARIFTSIQETGDMILVILYVVSTAANAVIVLQLLWYWNANKPNENQRKVNKKNK